MTGKKKETTYFVYMLRCGDSSLYTGITTDLQRRKREHQGEKGKGAKYTAVHGPVDFAAAWQCRGRAAASKLEYAIKKLKKGEKEELIREKDSLSPVFSTLDEDYTRISLNGEEKEAKV